MTHSLEEKINNSVNEVLSLYEQFGHLHYGEGVSQLQHMLQAAELAINDKHEDEMVIAAFLHDIGHLLASKDASQPQTKYGSVKHEINGATFLMHHGFSQFTINMVQNHVLAKRYLVASDPGYFSTLSNASKKTLEYQGGGMLADEKSKFENDPNFNDYLTLRKFDDEAKENRISAIKLSYMRSLLTSHLKQIVI